MTVLDILKKDNPHIIFKELYDSGELKNIFPELYNLYSDEKGYKNNFIHTLSVLKNVCNFSNDIKLKMVAVLHDIGKPSSKRFVDVKGWTFHNHEKIGADMSVEIIKKWGITDVLTTDYIYRMILYHGRVKIHRDSTESAIRRLDNEVGKDIIFDLIDFCKCDITTKFEEKKLRIVSFLDNLKQRIIEVRKIDEDSKWRSPLTGFVIMDILNIKEGRIIGDIKKEFDPKLKNNEVSFEEVVSFITNNKNKWIN